MRAVITVAVMGSAVFAVTSCSDKGRIHRIETKVAALEAACALKKPQTTDDTPYGMARFTQVEQIETLFDLHCIRYYEGACDLKVSTNHDYRRGYAILEIFPPAAYREKDGLDLIMEFAREYPHRFKWIDYLVVARYVEGSNKPARVSAARIGFKGFPNGNTPYEQVWKEVAWVFPRDVLFLVVKWEEAERIPLYL